MSGRADRVMPLGLEAGHSRLALLVLATALILTGAYAFVAIARIAYPYDLDFIEDGILMQAWRVAQGQPVFVPPNADFVPHVYMPLYTWLGGWLLKMTGPGYAPLRTLSLAATLTTAGLVYWIARREGSERILALVCAGLFLSGYRISGGQYELARVDALFLALTLAGVAVAVYHSQSAVGLAGTGLLLGLAFLAKQNGLVYGLITGLFLLMAVGRRAWIAIGVLVLLASVSTLWLHIHSHGWFSTYVFGIAFASPIEARRIASTLAFDLLGDMAMLTVMFCVVAGSLLLRLGATLRGADWIAAHRLLLREPWPLFIGAAILATVAGRASVGGNRNQLMQAYAFLCLVPPLVSHQSRSWSTRPRPWMRHALWLALLAQLGLTVVAPIGRFAGQDAPARYRPTAAMRASGDRFIQRLTAIQGEVLVMMHPYYALLAGKTPGVQIQALWHARWRGRDPLPQDLVSRIAGQQYAAIISDESMYFEAEPALVELIEAHYVVAERLNEDDAAATLSGMVVRPRSIYVPRR